MHTRGRVPEAASILATEGEKASSRRLDGRKSKSVNNESNKDLMTAETVNHREET